MSTTIMHSNAHKDFVWVAHPPRTRDSMYSPSQQAVGQNKVIPTISPSPILSIHAKQRYKLEEGTPNYRKRALIDILRSQITPVPFPVTDPEFRVAARPSLDRQPVQPSPLPQDVEAEIRQRQRPQEARLRQGSEADTPQVSRVFPKRCVPKESQSQPRKGPTYVAPGPSSLRQYIVYQTPSPEVRCAHTYQVSNIFFDTIHVYFSHWQVDTSVVSVKTQPIAECVSLTTVPPPDCTYQANICTFFHPNT